MRDDDSAHGEFYLTFRKLVPVLAMLSIWTVIAFACAGCAQFAAMTPQQKKVTAASIAGAVVAGYLLNDSDGDSFYLSTTNVYEGDELVTPPDGCHPEPRCR